MRPAILTILLAACTGALPASLSQRPRNALDERQVVETRYFNTRIEWEASPWFRHGGFDQMPVFLVVSHGRWACRVDGATWAMATVGEWVQCRPWLAAREET